MKKNIRLVPMALIIVLIIMNSIYISGGEYSTNLFLEYDGVTVKYDQRLVDIVIDDQVIRTGDMPAVIINARTLVPVREVFESELVGATVQWISDRQEIHVLYGDQFVVLKIDSNIAMVNGKEVLLDVPAKLIRDMSKKDAKTMIPLRFVAEQLGYIVKWDAENYAAKLYSDDYTGVIPGETIEQNDLINNGMLSELNTEGFVAPYNGSIINGTILENNPIIITASQDEKTPLTENKIVTDIESIESGSVEIYNLLFNYDEGTPEKVTFEVSADNPISGIITSVEDNIMELYVLKATLDMKTTSFEYDDNTIVDALSIVEYTGGQTGNRNCVIRFDLNRSGVIFNVRMNENREKIFIDIVTNHIDGLTIGQDSTSDYIDIKGVSTDQIHTYRPDATTLSFDIKNTNTLVSKDLNDINGNFIKSLSLSKTDATTTNLNVDLTDAAQYEISMPEPDTTRIRFLEPEFKEISYSVGNESMLILHDIVSLTTVDNIIGIDEYLNKKFHIFIPGNHVDKFVSSNIKVNSEGIDTIDIVLTDAGDTKITINTNGIKGVSMSRHGEDLVFNVKKPQEIYHNIIVIDPGHGGWKPGASNRGYYEKDINIQVTLKLKTYLDKNKEIKTYYVRLDDSHVSLANRASLANEVDSDLFLSLHCDSYYTIKTGAVSLYMDRETNREMSNYEFAKTVHDAYVEGTSFVDKVISERDNLYVLKYTKMPAALLEMGYMSNNLDLTLLTDEEHQELMAQGIYNGIIKSFDKLK